MTTTLTRTRAHLDLAERRALGEEAARSTPPAAHAEAPSTTGRRGPVELLVEQDATREPDLVGVRHGRMLVSAFTFFRGAARLMAADLAGTATSGLQVQLCGDAHLSNFGAYASPERQLVFGLNDFDETLPGPFEWDLKRMAASFTVAARNNGFTEADATAVTREAVAAYRTATTRFASMRLLDVWYARMSESDIEHAMRAFKDEGAVPGEGRATNGKKHAKRSKADEAHATHVAATIKAARKTLRKAHTRDSLQALSRLGEVSDGRYRIVSRPPVVVPLRELEQSFGMSTDGLRAVVEDQFRAYLGSLSDDRRQLLERFTIVDMARKVVGVGSVGTRAFIVLLEGRDHDDPLFLQVKEATRSVLEHHLPPSRYRNPGRRVVEGQRLLQESSDIFLGWTQGVEDDRFYYWRQLRDMKGSALVETMTPLRMRFYARMCGTTLARAHARSGDPVALAAYLGTDDTIDQAVATFAGRYADQNEEDYAAFAEAARDGSIEVVRGA